MKTLVFPLKFRSRSAISRVSVIAGAATVLALTTACSSPPPKEEMAVGRASVERATGPAAAEAPMELAMARDKIARANVAMTNKDYGTARRLAAEADADAQLAEAKARATRSEQALAQVRESIRVLRDQPGMTQ
jgi:hypothetical protein